MTQRTVDIAAKRVYNPVTICVNEIYSERPEGNNSAKKTDVYNIDDTWSLHILVEKFYGPENSRSYGYVLVVINLFSKCG